MGTSTSNNGPSNKTPLLPSWAQSLPSPPVPDPKANHEDEGENNSEPLPNGDENKPTQLEIPISGDWRPAKVSLSSYVNSPNTQKIKSAVKSYVRASGGAKGISKSVVSGKRTGIKLSSLLSSFSNIGVNNTFKEFFKLDIQGLSLESAINKIVDYLSPQDGTIEDSVTSNAITETLFEIYKNFDLAKNDLSALDQMTNENIKEILSNYATSYVYTKWINEIGIVLEKKNISPAIITKIERQMKEFIKDSIKLEFSDIVFTNKETFKRNKINKIMNDVFETAYKSLEGL